MLMKQDKIYGIHIDRDPDLITQVFADLGQKSAVANAAFQYLLDMQKVILAEVKLDCWRDTPTESGKKIALDLAETMALASPEYRAHLEKIKTAREQSFALTNRLKTEDKTLELLRSLESSVKSQINKLGA